MAVLSLGDLWAALAQSQWSVIVGTYEAEWVDFKVSPYQPDQSKGAWEFVKDVAGLANARGGVLVIGFATERLTSAATDVVTEHKPTRRDLVDGQKLLALVASRIYPRVRDVRLRWFPDPSELAVLVIEVPAQDEGQKPFIMEGSLSDEGKLNTGTLGLPRREGADVEWVRAVELHNLLRDGMAARQRDARPEQTHLIARVEQLKRSIGRRDEIVAAMGWQELPNMMLQAIPPAGTRGPLPGFHEEAGVRGKLRAPPSLRPNGFNLKSNAEPTLHEGALTYLGGSRKAFWLDMDGTFTVGGLGSEDWFGRGLNEPSAVTSPLKLNSLVLAEFTLEFFRFVHQVLVPLAPGQWEAAVWVQNLRSPRATALRPGPPDQWGMAAWNDSPPDHQHLVPFALQNPGADAFVVLRWFFALYGLPVSAIPFVEGEMISEERILERDRM